MQTCKVDGVKVFVDELARDYAGADRIGSFPPVRTHFKTLRKVIMKQAI